MCARAYSRRLALDIFPDPQGKDDEEMVKINSDQGNNTYNSFTAGTGLQEEQPCICPFWASIRRKKTIPLR